MVLDPYIDQHLAHFGIDRKGMKKTDKTVAELEIELQHTFDWTRIQEKDKKLIPLFGPGYTGIENLGNTCYMNSVLQVLFALPPFQRRLLESNLTFSSLWDFLFILIIEIAISLFLYLIQNIFLFCCFV
jgi:ubiquitin carboxyl-terminal hydrolase 5/13